MKTQIQNDVKSIEIKVEHFKRESLNSDIEVNDSISRMQEEMGKNLQVFSKDTEHLKH